MTSVRAVLAAVLAACAFALPFGHLATPAFAAATSLQGCTTFTLSKSRASIYHSGGTGTITVTRDPGCPWAAMSNISWITIAAPSSGTGNGTVTYVVEPNTGASRTGTFSINNVDVTITQPNDLNPEPGLAIVMSDLMENRVVRFTDLGGTGWQTGPTNGESFNAPWHIGIDSQRRIYVADRDNNRLVRMNDVTGAGWTPFSGVNQTPLVPPGNQIKSVTFDSSGRIYAPVGVKIARMDDMDGNGLAFFGSGGDASSGPGHFNNFKMLMFDSQGRFYVTDTDNYRIVRFDDLNWTNWTTFGSQGGGVGQFSRPEGLAIDGSGRIYVTDNENNRIVRINDMTGAGWVTFGSLGSGVNQLSEPHDIAVSAAGRIYISDTGNGRVVRIDDMIGSGWTAFGTGPNVSEGPAGLFQFQAPKGLRLMPTYQLFTDDTLTAGVTPIKAVHITELRSRIDAVRSQFGLAPFAWTDSSLAGLVIKAVHVSELRTAIVAAYSAANKTPPSFTDPALSGILVKTVHITDLRSAVIALEAN